MTSFLQSRKLSNSLFSCTEPLLLPVIPEQSAQDTELDVSTLLKQHQHFYSTDHRLDRDQAREKAASDVKAIRYAFPETRQSQTQLLMCSWFALLCAVDDEIESLRPGEALHTLTQLIRSIQQIYHGEFSNQRDLWRTTRAGPHDRQKQQHRLETLNQRLILSAQTTLPTTPYHEFLSQITQVWESMKDELTHRQSPQQQHDEDSYLQIRSLTVGLAPFFSILKAEFLTKTHSETVIPAHFDRLQEHISLTVGLQNDLVGLQRDMASAETWNLVLLKTQASTGIGFAGAVGEVVQMHNRQVVLAMEVFREIVERCGDRSGYTLVARSMLGFSTRHFLWASKAGRYRI